MANSETMIKAGSALIGVCCLVALGIVTMTSDSTTAAESVSLFASPASLRAGMTSSPYTSVHDLPGSGPWKDLAIASTIAANRCDRDVSSHAMTSKTLFNKIAKLDRNLVVKAESIAKETLKTGAVAPLGFFDPFGIGAGVTKGRLYFYREAEIKHGRVCMLAVLGTIVGENLHPLLGGANMAGVAHFTKYYDVLPDENLNLFWKLAALQNLVALSYIEISRGLPIIMSPGREAFDEPGGDAFALNDLDREPGDFGFDPLGMKPKTDKDLTELKNKELLNGRLAMIGAIGIIMQEWVTGKQVFR
jgi:light-harvesting complex I chlorophyll a/b binding protein 1